MKSIIIITYNSSPYILDCLKSVEKNITSKDEVFVIDNNSIDNTEEKFQEFIQDKNNFKLIKQNHNCGFAKAVNAGLEKVSGENIFLINPDTKFENGVFGRMIFETKKNKAGIVGAKQIRENKKPLGSFGNFPNKIVNFFETTWLAKIFPIGRYMRYNFFTKKIFNSNKQVNWVGGGFMLIKKEVVEKIGKFDENFFMYFEDVDFCFRAKQSGFSSWFLGEVEVLHHGGKSFSPKNNLREKYNKKSLQYFMQKYNL